MTQSNRIEDQVYRFALTLRPVIEFTEHVGTNLPVNQRTKSSFTREFAIKLHDFIIYQTWRSAGAQSKTGNVNGPRLSVFRKRD